MHRNNSQLLSTVQLYIYVHSFIHSSSISTQGGSSSKACPGNTGGEEGIHPGRLRYYWCCKKKSINPLLTQVTCSSLVKSKFSTFCLKESRISPCRAMSVASIRVMVPCYKDTKSRQHNIIDNIKPQDNKPSGEMYFNTRHLGFTFLAKMVDQWTTTWKCRQWKW